MRSLLIALLLVLPPCAMAAPPVPYPIEERMGSAEFKAAGLDKLSPEELARLNAWLRGQSDAVAEAARKEAADKLGFEYREVRDDIQSRIVGEFRGWDGGTTFELENGQVWQQIEAGSLVSRKMTNPAVTIRSAAFGAWRLKVEGYNSTVQVRRIK